jgi:aminoglycoside phosphotransferase (APT) family kinase protein
LRHGERMRRALDNLAEYHRGFPVCLVNGDTHLGNLYEEADGTPGFFDMQLARAPWQTDVAYHIVCALDIADRPRWEESLLTPYLSRRVAHGVRDTPDFDAAMEAYRREIVYGLFIFLINETRFQTEAVNTAYAARFGDAAVHHGTMDLLC